MTPPRSCALCGAENFRRCDCRWNQPFENWPKQALRALKRAIGQQV